MNTMNVLYICVGIVVFLLVMLAVVAFNNYLKKRNTTDWPDHAKLRDEVNEIKKRQ